jgi:hypothetical protein
MSTPAFLEDSDSDPELDELLSRGPVFSQDVKPSTPPKKVADTTTPSMKEEETVEQKGENDFSCCSITIVSAIGRTASL